MDNQWLKRAMPRALFCVFGLLAGVVFLLLGVGGYQRSRALAERGLLAQATVLHREVRTEQDRDSEGRKRTKYVYTVLYEFRTARGERVEARRSVGREYWEQHSTGSTMPVAYLPDDPGVHQLEGRPGLGEAGLYIAMTMLGALLAGWSGYRLGRIGWEGYEQARLLQTGAATTGIIRGFEMKQANMPWSRILYSYQDREGRMRRATSSGYYRDDIRGLTIGTVGTVRYDRENPARSLWVFATPEREPTAALRAEAQLGVAATARSLAAKLGADKKAIAKPGETVSADEVSAVETVGEFQTWRKRRGGRTLASGITMLALGGGTFYYYFIRHWLAGGKTPLADDLVPAVSVGAALFLFFGFILTLFGIVFALRPLKAALAGVGLLAVGAFSFYQTYARIAAAGGKLEGAAAAAEAVPALLGFLALAMGLLLLPISGVYAIIRAIAEKTADAAIAEEKKRVLRS
jgi:hypothetical protein